MRNDCASDFWFRLFVEEYHEEIKTHSFPKSKESDLIMKT